MIADSHHNKPTTQLAFAERLRLFLVGASKALGSEFVIQDQAEVEKRSKDPGLACAIPAAYLYPSGTEELRELLRLANEHRVPLWTHSTGKNWGYLSTSTSSESVVVILSRMNEILFVDNDLAYAEIQPGVTFQQLRDHLKNRGFDLWADSPGGPPSGSVLGNALDRGVGATNYADHVGNLCGLEVMLPSGELIRTGTNSDTSKGASSVYKYGVGPSWETMFSQSNFGIVTKASIWLMRKPKDYTLVRAGIRTQHDFAAVLDQSRELLLRGELKGPLRFSNDVAMFTLLTQVSKETLSGERALTKEDRRKLQEKYAVSLWHATFCIYGTKGYIRAVEKQVRSAFRHFADYRALTKRSCNLIFRAAAFLEKVKSPRMNSCFDWLCRKLVKACLVTVKTSPQLIELHEGSPVEAVVRRAYFRSNKEWPERNINVANDGIGLLWFVPVLPLVGRDVVEFLDDAEKEFNKADIDFYATVFTFTPRSCCGLMAILYDRTSEEECEVAEKLYSNLLALTHSRGYQIFRAGPLAWPKLYNLCPELGELNDTLKRAIDPNNILAPGRYGIGDSED